MMKSKNKLWAISNNFGFGPLEIWMLLMGQYCFASLFHTTTLKGSQNSQPWGPLRGPTKNDEKQFQTILLIGLIDIRTLLVAQKVDQTGLVWCNGEGKENVFLIV